MTESRKILARAAAAAAALALGALLAACGSGSLAVHGSMSIVDANNQGTSCDLDDTGYSDIAPGAQVTVTAPDGTVLGSGSLGPVKAKVGGADCEFPFTVTGVKGGEARYGVTVGHRGTVWFTPEQIPHAAVEIEGTF